MITNSKAKAKVYTNRLLKLADFLDKLPRKFFDYGNWAKTDGKKRVVQECGTNACALGWACTMPEFKRLGATLVVDFVDNDDGLYLAPRMRKENQSRFEYGVSEDVFGLSCAEHETLFRPGDDEDAATPKYVAKKIRKFVKAKLKEINAQ
jgi:hypothetical protein